ncbi:MAG: type II toxin-antitoxin system HicB family antitoxin [Alphaproteobacteria bacterium]
MAIVHYPAILEGDDASGYGVSFPDFPGCVSGGDSLQDAAIAAEQALRLHIRGMLEDGEALPDPTSFDDILVVPGEPEAGRMLVRAEIPSRAVRVNVTLDEGLLAAIDTTAAGRGLNRSAFLAEAARAVIYVGDETKEAHRSGRGRSRRPGRTVKRAKRA